jgi:hypothetical protein
MTTLVVVRTHWHHGFRIFMLVMHRHIE